MGKYLFEISGEIKKELIEAFLNIHIKNIKTYLNMQGMFYNFMLLL
ncbi:hypothetical protein Ctaglu_12260 [Clostridium tagluense]|uniref:Uncharacterized protein n=1 Tax=Clostridium tagluense TaxID=360422 RepID=A0A401UJ61_9CLOT|nr:hypothetical protein Ctaglu_12260 [Clostridium tagluense]